MNLIQFLSSLDISLLDKRSVICFQGSKEYPLLFFSLVRNRCKHVMPSAITTLDVTVQDTLSVKSQLETSFLGNRNFYWLNNLHLLTDKQRSPWLRYIEGYTGPNIIAVFLDKETNITLSKKSLVVTIPDTLDKKSFIALMSLFNITQQPSQKYFMQELFKRHRVLPLDLACILIEYMILGAQGSIFFDQWLDSIMGLNESLFSLSQYFFAKDIRLFSKQWHRLKDNFPDVFWVTFWSEQLWRAYNYVYLSQKKQFSQAKRIGFRLPFSFMQRDWHKASCIELKNAHQFIYDLDFKIKNAEGVAGLDLLYSKFFLHKFTNVSHL